MVPMEPTSLVEWSFHGKGFNPKRRQLYIDRAKDGVGLIIAGCFCFYSFTGTGDCIANHSEMFDGGKRIDG